MAHPPLDLCLYTTNANSSPGQALRACGISPHVEKAFGSCRLAAAHGVDPARGPSQASGPFVGGSSRLAWGWRTKRSTDRTARAVVLGPDLDGPALERVVDGLHAQGQLVTDLRPLSHSFRAVELTLIGPAESPVALTRNLTPVAEGVGVDVAVLPPPVDPDSWGLLIMDMDSTLLAAECIDELAEQAGRKEAVAAITERAMAGELDFQESLRERVQMLAGLPETALEETYRKRIESNPGAQRLLDTLRGLGIPVAVVSGGFTHFTEWVKQDLGVDYTNANALEIADGHLTGQVSGAIVDGAQKAATLRALRHRLGLSQDRTLAIGDGANDLPMIQEAGLGLAFHAKPLVQHQSPYNLAHSPLDGLLYFLGLTDAEIEAHRQALGSEEPASP